jgi:hypothetical protein
MAVLKTEVEQQRFDVLLCYNSRDKAAVKKVAEALTPVAVARRMGPSARVSVAGRAGGTN